MIKRLLLLLVIAFSFTACNEETLPVPNAFQTSLDNEFWVTNTYETTVSTNVTEITVTRGDEEIKFIINDDNVGTYTLNGVNHSAVYTENTTTGTEPYISINGEIEITEFDFLNKTISAHFNFRAARPSDTDMKSFARGEIYKVSFTTDNSFYNNIFGAYLDGTQLPLGAIAPQNIAGQIVITVTYNDGSKIIIKVPNNIAPGTYNLTSTGATTAQYIDASGTVFDACGTGSSINISSHDTTAQTIVGTFHFDACPASSSTASHSITLGTFSVAY